MFALSINSPDPKGHHFTSVAYCKLTFEYFSQTTDPIGTQVGIYVTWVVLNILHGPQRNHICDEK